MASIAIAWVFAVHLSFTDSANMNVLNTCRWKSLAFWASCQTQDPADWFYSWTDRNCSGKLTEICMAGASLPNFNSMTKVADENICNSCYFGLWQVWWALYSDDTWQKSIMEFANICSKKWLIICTSANIELCTLVYKTYLLVMHLS